jgi:hypothetical protein
MNRTTALLGAVLVLSSSAVEHALAQSAAPAASAPSAGMRGWRMSRDDTPGWSMMTRAERREHHDKMVSMTDMASCKAYMQQHHARMIERARTKGLEAPGKPRHDACDRLKTK